MKKIKKVSPFHPQANLPNQENGAESKFVNLFIKKYIQPTWHKSIFLREVPINSCGISDFVHVQGIERQNTKKVHIRKVIAFEMKLSDWKKALFQAFKYLEYANKSIVVIPYINDYSNKINIDAFKKLGVGLWFLDTQRNIIIKAYTPKDKSISQYVFQKIFLNKFVYKAIAKNL